jgi:hypothetical protein
MREKMKARAAVAKTSKKPSTHRWTTHQRQYSITERWLRALKKKPAAYMRPMAALAPVNIHTSEWLSSRRESAGQRPRSMRVSQSTRPTKRAICQARPRSTYS